MKWASHDIMREKQSWAERAGEDIGSGIAWGVAIAALLSLYALAVYFGIGVDPADAPPYGIHHVIMLYFMGGVTGGVILGLTKPVARRWWGAPIVGFLVAVPISSAFSLLEGGFDITGILIGSLGLGAPVGMGYWFIFR